MFPEREKGEIFDIYLSFKIRECLFIEVFYFNFRNVLIFEYL